MSAHLSQPILLDLNGNGIEITELHESSVYRAGEDGLQHISTWAGAGDGVLFYDADSDGKISGCREYVFTDWAPGAGDDMEELRQAFDSNGNGVVNASDAKWSSFKVEVTGADGRLISVKNGASLFTTKALGDRRTACSIRNWKLLIQRSQSDRSHKMVWGDFT